MNVFVLSTGRCGSTTFAKACAHITNYTADHESLRRGDETRYRERYGSLRFPQRHIEVDNRLSWFLGALEEQYGPDAFYVHLLRDRESVAKSFLNRWGQKKTNIIFSFAWGVLTHPHDQVINLTEPQKLRIAGQYWDNVNSNIRMFLQGKPRQMTIWLDNIKDAFGDFWQQIGAQGDLNAALEVWDTRHNASAGAATASAPVSATEVHRGKDETASSATAEGGGCQLPATVAVATARTVSQGDRFRDASSAAVGDALAALGRAMQTYGRVDLRKIHPAAEPSRWTLDANTLRLLITLIDELKMKHVVEFGSGLSTRVLAWACDQSAAGCRVTSLDHDPDFLRLSQEGLALHDRTAAVKMLFAPLIARKIAGRTLPAYHFSRSEVASRGEADLILVDGPPRALGGREGALYQAIDLAHPGTLVLLDDAHRKEEQVAIGNLARNLGRKIRLADLPGFPKGLLAITVVNPVGIDDVVAPGVSRTTRVLLDSMEAMEPAATWIVVDDGVLSPDAFADAGTTVLPFLEQDGRYWGAPASDRQAIDGVERMSRKGARYLAFVDWSFWWLEHYEEFRKHLESHYRCLVRNDQLIVFALQVRDA